MEITTHHLNFNRISFKNLSYAGNENPLSHFLYSILYSTNYNISLVRLCLIFFFLSYFIRKEKIQMVLCDWWSIKWNTKNGIEYLYSYMGVGILIRDGDGDVLASSCERLPNQVAKEIITSSFQWVSKSCNWASIAN